VAVADVVIESRGGDRCDRVGARDAEGGGSMETDYSLL
jgi:hypothetical protein